MNPEPQPAEDPRLTGHEYDGIREYDNPTPAWWHLIFVGTVLFSVVYFTFWHYSPVAYTPQQALARREVAEYKRVFGQLGELTPDEPTVISMMKNPQMMAVARGIFVGNCAPCHAQDGGGINGVNLTDDYYKNCRSIADIFPTITKGANVGAMPAWETRLGQNERIILAAYVATLRGTRPAVPKPPEGEPVPPWDLGGE
jgi:cytochrome c oxidase cbb3-type subunit 3